MEVLIYNTQNNLPLMFTSGTDVAQKLLINVVFYDARLFW